MTRQQLIGDALLAAALATLGILTTGAGMAAPARTPIDALGLVLIGATGLVLVVRRRWPLATLAAATAATAGYLLLGYPFGLIFAGFAVAVYTVARHRPLTTSVPAAVVALGLLLVHLLVDSEGAVGIAYGSAWVAVPLGIGATVRARQEVAARARADTIRAHVDDERLRVAQEVHDIVGHGLAAIKMQADVALHVLAKKPDQAQTALDAISRTSSQALEELRATLAVVRDTGGDAGRAPAPSLTRLGELSRRMAEAGLYVSVEVLGEPRPLPQPVDLSGYRIVQESLTNVLRHGGADRATVTVRYQPKAVEIVVSNRVVARPSGRGGGSGIPGMRQRALDLGGDFEAGPTADGRFEVTASLPIGENQ
jgi:signal transduction histidine kinase